MNQRKDKGKILFTHGNRYIKSPKPWQKNVLRYFGVRGWKLQQDQCLRLTPSNVLRRNKDSNHQPNIKENSDKNGWKCKKSNIIDDGFPYTFFCDKPSKGNENRLFGLKPSLNDGTTLTIYFLFLSLSVCNGKIFSCIIIAKTNKFRYICTKWNN